MGLIGETAGVFEFLRNLYNFLPVAVKLLIVGAFGGTMFIAVLRSVKG